LGLENYRKSVSESKRAAILRAGRENFLKHGYSRAAMAEIAREADVSTATLYKHFASKEELFAAVVREAYGELGGEFAEIPAGMSAEELMFRLAQNYIDIQFGQSVNALMRVVIAEVPSAPQLARDMFENMVQTRYRDLERIFNTLIERGKLKPHDTHFGVRLIGGVIKEYFIWPSLFDPEFKAPANRDEILREAIKTYMTLYGP
jgi:TetR/AcrR family transcriptional regulator of autoinduction and epiphytic fitness